MDIGAIIKTFCDKIIRDSKGREMDSLPIRQLRLVVCFGIRHMDWVVIVELGRSDGSVYPFTILVYLIFRKTTVIIVRAGSKFDG